MFFAHIFYDHDLRMLLLALGICGIGCTAGVLLWARTLETGGREAVGWTLLSSIVLGATIWTTHFIAMLGYVGSARATFDLELTALSIGAAVIGVFIALSVSSVFRGLGGQVVGGATTGVAISTMHVLGMLGFEAGRPFVLSDVWHTGAVLVGALFGFASVRLLRSEPLTNAALYAATAAFASGIVGVHFTAMASFHAQHAAMLSGLAPDSHRALALSVSTVALILIATGGSTYLIQSKLSRRSAAQLREMARTDGLTGVVNRDGFNVVLDDWCDSFRKDQLRFSLLFVDLDRFKPVNDVFGHAIGDEVLRLSVERISCVVGERDVVGRLGGDEFAVLVADATEADRVADHIVDVVRRPFVIGTRVIEIGASVGVVEPTEISPLVASSLSQAADMALYEAKESGRQTWKRYSPRTAERFNDRRLLEFDLRRAVARQEFEVYFQPVADPGTQKITGAEALLRWQHPTRGFVSPTEFIPMAEEIGLIIPLGRWVLRTACETAASWPEELRLSVNVSPMQLRDTRFVQVVRDALEHSGLSARRLDLEITESALIDNEEAGIAILEQLRRIGVTLSLDDFGTGFSSLSHLHRFPLDRMKIDRSFVSSAETDPKSARIVEAISQLGGALGLRVTAEGVETSSQLSLVAQSGCDTIQGYLISRPISATDMAALLSGKGETSSRKTRRSA